MASPLLPSSSLREGVGFGSRPKTREISTDATLLLYYYQLIFQHLPNHLVQPDPKWVYINPRWALIQTPLIQLNLTNQLSP